MASTSSSSTKPTLLLFGVTGMTGKHVLAQAASLPSDQWRVVAFVRSPSKMDAAGAAAVASGRVEVVQGDCTDAAAVTACITTSVRPDAIVLTINVGFSNDLTKSVNKGLLPLVTDALASSGRLEACRVIYLSGAASPNPPVPADYPYSFIQWAVQIKAPIADNNAAHNFFHAAPAALRYVVVKMGMVVEGPSAGTLHLHQCPDGGTFGFVQIMGEYPGVKFCDVGACLVALATSGEAGKQHERQYFVMKYAAT